MLYIVAFILAFVIYSILYMVGMHTVNMFMGYPFEVAKVSAIAWFMSLYNAFNVSSKVE